MNGCQRVVTIVLLTLTLFAGSGARADSGNVIDGATGKPLPGVHVIAVWNARVFKGIETSHSCFYVDAAQTNERGEFSISSWSGNLVPMLYDRRRSLLFYAREYKGPESEPKDGDTYVMLPDNRSGLDRLKYIGWVAGRSACGDAKQQAAVLKPVYRAMYEESIAIAKSREELGWANSALADLERLELGEDRARANFAQREKEWGIAVVKHASEEFAPPPPSGGRQLDSPPRP